MDPSVDLEQLTGAIFLRHDGKSAVKFARIRFLSKNSSTERYLYGDRKEVNP